MIVPVSNEITPLEVRSQMLILSHTQVNYVVTYSSPRITFQSLTYNLQIKGTCKFK